MKLRFALLLLGSTVLAGCSGDEHSDLKQWMTEASKDLRGRVPPLPQIKTFPVVDYESGELPDPFTLVKLDTSKLASASGPKPDLNRRKEPLEAFPLETLRMVGLLDMKSKPVAIVAADKTLFQVRVGNYMGQNFGVVTKITESEITLKELVEDANGDWVERMSTLLLQDQETKK